MAAVAQTVGDPRNVRLEEQVQISGPRASCLLDPRGTAAEIMVAIHDGAHEIGVEHDEMFRRRDRGVLGRDLATRDRSVIVESELSSACGRVVTHELFRDWS